MQGASLAASNPAVTFPVGRTIAARRSDVVNLNQFNYLYTVCILCGETSGLKLAPAGPLSQTGIFGSSTRVQCHEDYHSQDSKYGDEIRSQAVRDGRDETSFSAGIPDKAPGP